MYKISYKEILYLKCNLAPSQLTILDIPNKNIKLVRDLLDRKLIYSDKGIEIGSVNYISRSSHFFMKAKALQSNYFMPFLDNESVIPIRPQVFKDFKLNEGDIIISKDSNIGESAILDKNYPNYALSGALYKLPITKHKLYLFAFLKHDYFKKQLSILVPKGSIISHAKTLFLGCKIPFPNQKNANEVIRYIELLTQAIINKEKEIGRKNKLILYSIKNEIVENQKRNRFNYKLPSIKDIKKIKRLDTGLYSEEFKRLDYLIKNYKFGISDIETLGYNISRGQNLQISNIGKSIYSEKYKFNFYKLLLSKYFTDYMTVANELYLGNSKKLKTVNKGEIIFSSRGNLGRVVVLCDEIENTITNIDNFHITNLKTTLTQNIFIGVFLNFLKANNYLSKIAITGSGADSFTKYQFKLIPIPNFQESKQKEIAELYHNRINYPNNLNLENFLEEDKKWNEKAGIIEIDKSIKTIKKMLDTALDKIINDEGIEINLEFNFLA